MTDCSDDFFAGCTDHFQSPGIGISNDMCFCINEDDPCICRFNDRPVPLFCFLKGDLFIFPIGDIGNNTFDCNGMTCSVPDKRCPHKTPPHIAVPVDELEFRPAGVSCL